MAIAEIDLGACMTLGTCARRVASLALGIALAVALACTPNAIAGGCSQWMPGPIPAAVTGANGPIYAMTEWALPGQPLQLIVGGDFSRIGGVVANNIAAWDGGNWRALGDGAPGPVHALTTHNVALIAGGEDLIQSWNGSQWASLGTVYTTQPFQDHATVRALASFNGQLYAGGDFDIITLDRPYNLWSAAARFDGTQWHSAWNLEGDWVYAMQVFDQDGAGPLPAELYVGASGSPSLFKTADGVNISNIPDADGSVRALAVTNSIGPMPAGLLVGGRISTYLDPQWTFNVRLWTGSAWHALGLGAGGSTDRVNAISIFGSQVNVGGDFDDANGGAILAKSAARWNGSAWSALGQVSTGYGVDGVVHAMRTYGGSMYAGGDFASAYNAAATNIARWNGSQWFAANEPRTVYAATTYGSRLVLGGTFASNTSGFFALPSANRYNIFTWDGLALGGLGLGTNGSVRALLSYTTSGPLASNNLVAGGVFTVVYGDGFSASTPVAANCVAVWSESATVPSAWQPMGAGFNSTVHALQRFNGWVVAGGAFTASGATTTNRVAKYVGSPPSWQPLTSPDPGINGTVYALKAFSDTFGTNNYLIMGGDFTSATPTGVAANRILMRVESPVAGQSAYQALGAGFNNTVYAIERYGNGLSARTYAAGAFTASGAVTVNRVARLNGSAWEAVGNGTGFNNTVYALRTIGAHLYAGGAFTSVDGIAANRIARFNGTSWEAVDVGADNTVYALLGFGPEVIAGGAFATVGSPAQASAGVARWLATGAPWLSQQPGSRSVACTAVADFVVNLASGYESVGYQWRKDGVPLSNGPTGHGSTISGALTNRLVVSSAQPLDAASYACVVSNACGSTTSTAATLTVTGDCCPADINNDSLVNVTDLLAVIGVWGACVDPNNCPPDINNDDAVNVTDLLAVIGAWGACP